jgi:hypothetical protein
MNGQKEWRTMKTGKLTALLATIVLVACANADTLRLHSGQSVKGTFVEADAHQLKTYVLTDVQSITSEFVPQLGATVPVRSKQSVKVTLLAGALIPVRLLDTLDTATTKTGSRFTATLDSNLVAGGVVVARRGATVHGKVTKSENARRLAGKSELQIELTDIVINGATQPIVTSGFQQKGASEGAKTAKKTAGGAGLGAIIGAIGGSAGKGAAIGAVTGLGVSMIKKGEPIRLPAETLLEFTLKQPTILPVQR